jgi:hypothetical protein
MTAVELSGGRTGRIVRIAGLQRIREIPDAAAKDASSVVLCEAPFDEREMPCEAVRPLSASPGTAEATQLYLHGLKGSTPGPCADI